MKAGITLLVIISAMLLKVQAQEQQPLASENLNLSNIVDTAKILTLINDAVIITGDNTDSAIAILEETKKWSERRKYNRGIVLSLMELSTTYSVKNNSEKARALLNEARRFCLLSDDKYDLLKWQMNFAWFHNYRGYTDSAIIELQPIRQQLNSITDTQLLIQFYTLYSAVLISNGDGEAAYPYLVKAKSLINKENANLIVTFLNLAVVYSSRGDTANLYANAKSAYDLARKIGRPKYERTASLYLIHYYALKGDIEQVTAFAGNAVRLLDKSNTDDRVSVYYRIAMAFYQNRDYKQAFYYGNLALSYIKPEQLPRKDLVELFKIISFAYDELGNRDSAFHYLLIYNNLKDAMNVADRNKAIDQVEKRFQLASKDRQLLLQQAKIRNRNMWIMGIGGSVILVLTLSVLFFSRYRNAQRKMHLLEKEKEVDELKAILSGEEKERNRMAKELHDGVGGLLSAAALNLNSMKEDISGLANSTAYHKTQQLVNEIANEIRKTAHNLMPNVILNHNIDDAIRLYCSHINRNTALEITLQSNGDFGNFDTQFKLSLYRIIQELIQNILKHAQATSVFVQLQRTQDLLTVTIEDNGKGFDVHRQHEGMGLGNIKERVALFGGEFFIDSSSQTGTSVYMEFDVALNNG